MTASDDMSAFARIVDLGSFARAAEDLHVAPSALSKRVSRLEDRLGVRLLNRTTRRLALTAEGEIYLARARDILALVESAEAEVTASRNAPKGHLRINTGAAIASRMADREIPEFLSRFPEIFGRSHRFRPHHRSDRRECRRRAANRRTGQFGACRPQDQRHQAHHLRVASLSAKARDAQNTRRASRPQLPDSVEPRPPERMALHGRNSGRHAPAPSRSPSGR